jgi:hypothetical protein
VGAVDTLKELELHERNEPGKPAQRHSPVNLEESEPEEGSGPCVGSTPAHENAPSRGATPRSRGPSGADAENGRRALGEPTARGQGLSTREVCCAGREAPERDVPWTWLGDETSPGARARSKPSGG